MDTKASEDIARYGHEYAAHERTYRYFVRGVALSAAFVLLVLIILAYATL